MKITIKKGVWNETEPEKIHNFLTDRIKYELAMGTGAIAGTATGLNFITYTLAGVLILGSILALYAKHLAETNT